MLKYLMLSNATQDQYLRESNHGIKHSDADKYEAVKGLALASVIRDMFRRIQHLPKDDGDHKGKCDRCSMKGRESEGSNGRGVSRCGIRETGLYLG